MENIENTKMICKDCSKNIKKEVIEQLKKLNHKINIGDLIKVNFSNKKYSENMWVEILEYTNNKIIGILQNQPFFLNDINYGDIISVNLNTLTGYISKDKKIIINPIQKLGE